MCDIMILNQTIMKVSYFNKSTIFKIDYSSKYSFFPLSRKEIIDRIVNESNYR